MLFEIVFKKMSQWHIPFIEVDNNSYMLADVAHLLSQKYERPRQNYFINSKYFLLFLKNCIFTLII
jgi:hypothetical protein